MSNIQLLIHGFVTVVMALGDHPQFQPLFKSAKSTQNYNFIVHLKIKC